MLGCKYFREMGLTNVKNELIDTCWDVNSEASAPISSGVIELIDTCWDVNNVTL